MNLKERFLGDRNYAIACTMLALMFALVLGSLFLISKTITEVVSWSSGDGQYASNTISVEATAEVVAVPDVATFTFGVTKEAESVELAQEETSKIANAAIDYLKDQGIKDEDIKTVNFSVNPRYEYSFCNGVECPPQQRSLIAYEVDQRVQVKVRDIEKASSIIGGLTSLNVTNVSGLSFEIDDVDALKEEARSKAVAQAREKAERLADELGVKLKKVVSFNEDSSGGPIYYEARSLGIGGGPFADSSIEPKLPVGENTVTSRVYVTYEIK